MRMENATSEEDSLTFSTAALLDRDRSGRIAGIVYAMKVLLQDRGNVVPAVRLIANLRFAESRGRASSILFYNYNLPFLFNSTVAL